MKNLLFICLLITSVAFSQEDTTFYKVSKTPNERINESGSITFTKTLNSLQFNRYTNQEYKDKITRFMQTNHRNYTALGTYTLHLVKRNGKLYILEQKLPEKLILLN
jgi:hypothetical protein